jgi:hypothetical protein
MFTQQQEKSSWQSCLTSCLAGTLAEKKASAIYISFIL